VRTRWRSGRRQGLTLVEVLLVLGLLVILASLAGPLLDRPLANRRLRVAADTLRTEWTRARNQAIAEGLTVRFQCTLGERRYSIDRQETTSSEFGDLTALDADNRRTGAVEPFEFSNNELRINSEDSSSGPMLPEGITFLTVEVADESEVSLGLDEDQGAGEDRTLSCTPLLFYPDGTTSTARVVLQNEYERSIEVTLRGLTGVASVGEISAGEGQLP